MDNIEKIKIENDNLRKINANKSELISVTAHQLRTSLSAFKWMLKMFVSEDLGPLTPEQKDYLEKAILSNDRSISLINDLLTFNTEENFETILNIETVNIETLVENVLSSFYGEIKNKNIKITFNKLALNTPLVKCDEEMMIVVLQNLIENAIKYSDTHEEIIIEIKKDEGDNKMQISIHNTGLDIEEEYHSKIFGKFFRTPKAIERENIGSGIGLYTAKNIILKNDGKIWFESSKENGTTFFVTLPIS